ncbi:MAG: hypothetical protein IT340_06175 [Chloroflexi bacterium]|nr:hypothetical protein [Chloroflexota bacterium]
MSWQSKRLWARAAVAALALCVVTTAVAFAGDWITTGTLQGRSIEGRSSVTVTSTHSGWTRSTASAAVDEIWARSFGQQNCDGIYYSVWDSGWGGNFNWTSVQMNGSGGIVCTGTQYHYYRTFGTHEWWVGTDGRTGTSCDGLTSSAC